MKQLQKGSEPRTWQICMQGQLGSTALPTCLKSSNTNVLSLHRLEILTFQEATCNFTPSIFPSISCLFFSHCLIESKIKFKMCCHCFVKDDIQNMKEAAAYKIWNNLASPFYQRELAHYIIRSSATMYSESNFLSL